MGLLQPLPPNSMGQQWITEVLFQDSPTTTNRIHGTTRSLHHIRHITTDPQKSLTHQYLLPGKPITNSPTSAQFPSIWHSLQFNFRFNASQYGSFLLAGAAASSGAGRFGGMGPPAQCGVVNVKGVGVGDGGSWPGGRYHHHHHHDSHALSDLHNLADYSAAAAAHYSNMAAGNGRKRFLDLFQSHIFKVGFTSASAPVHFRTRWGWVLTIRLIVSLTSPLLWLWLMGWDLIELLWIWWD